MGGSFPACLASDRIEAAGRADRTGGIFQSIGLQLIICLLPDFWHLHGFWQCCTASGHDHAGTTPKGEDLTS